MKVSLKKLIAGFGIVVLIGLPFALTAQPPDPDPGCNPDFCPTDNPFCCVPIDGGLSLLIAAGIGLGAKKAYDRKKAAVKNAE